MEGEEYPKRRRLPSGRRSAKESSPAENQPLAGEPCVGFAEFRVSGIYQPARPVMINQPMANIASPPSNI
jgi:hypothetical protein